MKKIVALAFALAAFTTLVQADFWSDLKERVAKLQEDPTVRDAAEKARQKMEQWKEAAEKKVEGWSKGTKNPQEMTDAELEAAHAEKLRREAARK